MLHTYYSTTSIPRTTAKRPLLTLRAVAALVPLEDPVGVLVLLVGAEVPLADDADFVAPDADGLEVDLLVDVWLVLEVPEPVALVLVSVEEEVKVEEEEVELDMTVIEADGDALTDPAVLEPSTIMLSL